MDEGICGALNPAMYFAHQAASQPRQHSLNAIILMPLHSFAAFKMIMLILKNTVRKNF